jgi:hypothetical protein
LGEKVIYRLKVFLGYQKIMYPRGTKTFKGRMSKKKNGFYEG